MDHNILRNQLQKFNIKTLYTEEEKYTNLLSLRDAEALLIRGEKTWLLLIDALQTDLERKELIEEGFVIRFQCEKMEMDEIPLYGTYVYPRNNRLCKK